MEFPSPPQYVKNILSKLEMLSFQAFLVGGCVRNIFLGKRPNDWDICTSALPEDILAIFPGSLPTGIKHGTVTIRASGRFVEVTTFRAESAYSDHRRPDSVSFISDLESDLSRRDFTMNAIALSISGIVTDPFCGRADIESKLVRCVGSPADRFEEDALRMFRALRFSAQLGFEIEPGTRAAISDKNSLARNLAPERVRDELEKILLSDRPRVASEAIDLRLLETYLDSGGSPDCLYRLSSLPKQRVRRWSGFCAALSDSGLTSDTAEFLRSLRLDNKTVKNCSLAVSISRNGFPKDSGAIKRLFAKYGAEPVLCAAAAADVFSGGHQKAAKRVLQSGDCFSLKRLALNGDDLMALGFEGRAIGSALRSLLLHVLDHPDENNRAALLSLAARRSSSVL